MSVALCLLVLKLSRLDWLAAWTRWRHGFTRKLCRAGRPRVEFQAHLTMQTCSWLNDDHVKTPAYPMPRDFSTAQANSRAHAPFSSRRIPERDHTQPLNPILSPKPKAGRTNSAPIPIYKAKVDLTPKIPPHPNSPAPAVSRHSQSKRCCKTARWQPTS